MEAGGRTVFGLPALGINFCPRTNVPGVASAANILTGHVLPRYDPADTRWPATMGYSVAILSYYRSLYFGMMAEPRVMPDRRADESIRGRRIRGAQASVCAGEVGAGGRARDAGLESASA